METAVYTSGFLLLLFSTGTQLSPEPHLLFGKVGGALKFEWDSDSSLLYRVSADGDLLLANCSWRGSDNYYIPKSDGYEVVCLRSNRFYFLLNKLIMSQSGVYRIENWDKGNLPEHTNYRLVVCGEGNGMWPKPRQVEEVYDDDDAVVCKMDTTLGHNRSLQVYRFDYNVRRDTLVLDTNSSLESLEEDLRGRLQVDLNTSLVTLSGATGLDDEVTCTVWRGAQCQSLAKKRLSVGSNLVFAHTGDNITLPCMSKGQYEVQWRTPTGHHKFNMTDQQEVMYHNQTGNYSLFIPSVSQHHSGGYVCHIHDYRKILTFDLYVCPLVSPLDLMFSHGENVSLNYTLHMSFTSVDGIMWYRQRVLEPQVLILDSRKGSASLPEDLRGRVSLRGQVTWRGRETYKGKLTKGERLTNSPLILSNLTAEDSGVYTWRVYEQVDEHQYNCSEGSIRLAYLDLCTPCGVHPSFYRAYVSLMGCGLLGLVAAVIWFKLRSRRGEQTSGRQSREGQQSGDEDLYENVEMTEISG